MRGHDINKGSLLRLVFLFEHFLVVQRGREKLRMKLP